MSEKVDWSFFTPLDKPTYTSKKDGGVDWSFFSPIDAAEKRTWGEAVTDTAVSFAGGANALLETGGSIYGLLTGDMDNWAREQGESGRRYWDERKSDSLKAGEADRRAKIDSADGQWAKAGTAFWETLSNPSLLTSFAAEQIPMFLPIGLAGRAGQAASMAAGATAKTAGKIGTSVGVGSGAVLQGGDVGGDAYQELLKLPDNLWAQNQEYQTLSAEIGDGAAKEVIALDLSRRAATEGGVASVLTNMLPFARTFERATAKAGTGLTGNFLARGAKGFAGEAAQEASEEGLGRVSVNRAVGDIDPSRELSQGVGEAAGLGAIGGGVMGGLMGAASGRPTDPIRDGGTQPPAPTDPITRAAADLGPTIADDAIASFEATVPVATQTTSQPSATPNDSAALLAEIQQSQPDAIPAAELQGLPEIGQNTPLTQQTPAVAENPAVNPTKSVQQIGAAITPESAKTPQAPAIAPAGPSLGFKEAFASLENGGITEAFYQKAFQALQEGKQTISGVKDPILSRAKSAFDSGLITSAADIRQFEQGGYPQTATQPQGQQNAAQATPPADLANGGETHPAEMNLAQFVERQKAHLKSIGVDIDKHAASLIPEEMNLDHLDFIETALEEGMTVPAGAFGGHKSVDSKNYPLSAKLFDLANPAKAQAAAPVLAKQPKPQAQSDNLISRIHQLGGININTRSDVLRDKRGAPGLFSANGRGLDELATELRAEGFDIDVNDVDGGVGNLAALIEQSLNGNPVYNDIGQARVDGKLREAAARDELKAEIDALGGAYKKNYSTKKLQEIADNLRKELPNRAKIDVMRVESALKQDLTDEEWAALLSEADAAETDSDYTQYMAGQIDGQQQERGEIDATQRRYQEETGGDFEALQQSRANENAQAGGSESRTEEAQGQPAEGLTSYTNRDILDREAKAERAKQEAEKAPPSKNVTADQVDMFNPQDSLFTSNREEPEPQANEPAPSLTKPEAKEIESISVLVDTARTPGRAGNEAYDIYRDVSDQEAELLQEKSGVDVHGYQHGMDEAAIRHIFKEHGNSEVEKTKGQVAVTAEDFLRIPEITDPAIADSVERGTTQDGGVETIVYRKRYNGYTYVVEEIRTGRKRLALKTMWKVRAAPRATSEEGVVQTSETFGAQPPTGNANIAPEQPNSNAKESRPSIESIPPARLKKIKVSVDAMVGNQIQKMDVPAKQALADINDEIKAYELLLACVKGA